ncbi:LysR family transcriptional regulator [Thermobrachium celere]|uniref:Transcriptional regulatory protein n=1 Tax=Thermobrachium celere DSM 8682 TaxID=941824 RepID=R7RSI0_9CLOT|nr:LysR family transcriptional regulator [Thermobrachium celere]GFR35549.1 LysR family transcriptional regulator [Thermobrachium celere]CDF59142.1 transcriptional regulatory protein [Thermobrachium celere DSM 8682]
MDAKLTSFIALAKFKNYTNAAEYLNLTQPAVSQHIKSLEDYYGVKLFRKKGRNIELTDEGKILFKYAQNIEILYRKAFDEIKNKTGIQKTYNVGASMTIGGYVLPKIIAEFQKINENIKILLEVYNTEDIEDKLLKRELDFAVVEGPFDRNKFCYNKFKDDELVLAVSPEHYFATQKEVDIEEVLKGNLILREKGSGTRKIFEQKLEEIGYNINDIKPYMEIGSINAIISLVEANLGYTIISKEAIKKELSIGTLKEVPIKDIRIYREFNFIYLEEAKDEFIGNFIDFCIMNISLNDYKK